MGKLDIFTLFFVLGVSSILACGFAWFLFINNRTINGVLAVALSSSCFAFGFGVIALREFLPGWLSFVAGNAAVFCGYALVLFGLLQFTGRRTDWRLLLCGLVIYSAEYSYFYFVDDNFKARLLCYLLAYSAISIWALTVTITEFRKTKMTSCLASSAFFLFLSLSFLVSAAITLPTDRVKDIHSMSALNSAVVFEQIIFVIGWIISFTLMVNERLFDERNQATNELNDKNIILEQSNADLEQFAYVASHDLQTPLNNIVHFAQLLDHRYRGQIDDNADDFLGFIVDGGKHMTSLIHDLLDFSRASRHLGALRSVPAVEAIDQALKNLELEIDKAGAEVIVGDLPLVMADQTRLVSLFQNLISNAVKYRHPEHAPQVSISAVRISAEFWQFAVVDNGIGIDPAYHSKVFEIFQRLAPAEDSEGTGIGLTLCRRIVTSFGGTIWVESSPGNGATFFFTLKDGRVPH
jgi:signal transduction histidine kinase